MLDVIKQIIAKLRLICLSIKIAKNAKVIVSVFVKTLSANILSITRSLNIIFIRSKNKHVSNTITIDKFT